MGNYFLHKCVKCPGLLIEARLEVFCYKPSCFSLENCIIIMLTSLFIRLFACENWNVCSNARSPPSVHLGQGTEHNCQMVY